MSSQRSTQGGGRSGGSGSIRGPKHDRVNLLYKANVCDLWGLALDFNEQFSISRADFERRTADENQLSQLIRSVVHKMNPRMLRIASFRCAHCRSPSVDGFINSISYSPDEEPPTFVDCLAVPTCSSCRVALRQTVTSLLLRGGGEVAAALRRTDTKICGCCGRTDMPDMLRCSRCRVTYYCSTKCQRKDWKVGHKQQCCPPADPDLD